MLDRLNIFRWYLHFKRGSYLLTSHNIIPRTYFWAEPFWGSLFSTSGSSTQSWWLLTQILNKILNQIPIETVEKILASNMRWICVLIMTPALVTWLRLCYWIAQVPVSLNRDSERFIAVPKWHHTYEIPSVVPDTWEVFFLRWLLCYYCHRHEWLLCFPAE